MIKKQKRTIRGDLRPISPGRSRKINKIFYNVSKERGKLSEERVCNVLEKWKNENRIIGYGLYDRGSYQDLILKVDGWLVTSEGEFVEFQIKSSQRGKQRFSSENPNIPVISASFYLFPTLEELEKEMFKVFKNYFQD